MAARRKSSAKKKRARRGSRGTSAAEEKKKQRARAATPKKPATRPEGRVSSKKKRAVAPTKKRAATRPKGRVSSRKKKLALPTPAQRAAITRTLRAFVGLPTPREYTRIAQKDIYRTKQNALVAALVKAGFSPTSIRARLGWLTRRRNKLRAEIATTRVIILGATVLHGSDPDQRRILETMIRERDERFLRFAEEMKQVGLVFSEVINEWFSPKVQGA